MNKTLPKKINPLINQIFPEEDLRHKYKVKKIIGKGQYGYVAKAISRKDNQFVAIKKLINIFHNEFETKRILREIILLKNCMHENIVSLIEILLPQKQNIENFDKIYIVTEYCQSDLRNLFKMQEMFLQLQDVKYILYQIACGIKYLHSASIVHRDLTPSNVLINGQGMKIKICDLGLARVIQKKQEEDFLDNSSDQEKLQQQINELSLKEKQTLKNDLLNSFQILETDSLPTTPNQSCKGSQISFDNQFQFIHTRRHSNQCIKIKQQVQFDLTSSVNIDDIRNSLKSSTQSKQPAKKKRLHQRMNSKRIGGSEISPKQILSNGKQQKNQKKRLSTPLAKLTLRVTTRWYRAPEIILLQKGYNRAIDIWSFGCLFGQLIKMMKNVCYNSMQRFPLFPGNYCYPVSPATLCNINKQMIKNQESSSYKQDQLFMILSTIGKPTQKQMSFLTDQSAKDYIKSIQNLQRKSLRNYFPSVSKQAVDILEHTLLFDPRQRMNIEEILNHPFLQSVRNKQMQKEAIPIIMEFEEQQNLTLDKLRQYLTNEIKVYQN